MPDLGAISVGLHSIKTALDITKELRSIDSSLKDAEVKLKLAELVEALSEAKIQLSEAREENLELKSIIKELENKINQKGDVVFRDGHYYLSIPQEGKPEGPFCSKCYSDENKLILLDKLPPTFKAIGSYTCPKCKAVT